MLHLVPCAACRCRGAAEPGAAEAALVPHPTAGAERRVPLRRCGIPTSPHQVDTE